MDNRNLSLSELTAVSPIDGRYGGKTKELAPYFSEWALMKYRVKVEVEYFLFLAGMPLPQLASFPQELAAPMRALYEDFSVEDARRVKEIESVTNHDVKAVEYFIKERMAGHDGFAPYREFVHFGLTSQDINNTAIPLMLRDAIADVIEPAMEEVAARLDCLSIQWDRIPMLARTHGQPASPTRLGKEVEVFIYRLENQREVLGSVKLTAKLGGATGNFNAHHVAYPDIDWPRKADEFVGSVLGLEREQLTTQISNYDSLAETFDALRRICTVLIDLDRDMWQYVSMDYFKQKIKEGEVGSSAMPHKVNPIDFENSEGNLGIAVALLEHLSRKLPVSRLQRDLTDSTVIRNIGVPLGHMLIALKSTFKGLDKLLLNEERISADLDGHWAVVAEAIQTILRREGYPNPYETLKQLTRTNEQVTAGSIAAFIDTLSVSDSVKAELKAITPHNYTGV